MGSSNARPHLLRAVADPSELRPVREYAAMSLGMIGHHDAIAQLSQIHDAEADLRFQLLLAHVLLFLGGLR